MWQMDHAPGIAAEQLKGLPRRWAHVRTVGRLADELVESAGVPGEVAAAAWLHDVGYSPRLAVSGFHPLDGAAYLRALGAPDEVVGLVAHHTGAVFEAEERGLAGDLAVFPAPDPVALDALTLVDLVAAPDGSLTDPGSRVAEIMSRYPAEDPVHRAVVRSRPFLLAAAERARARLALADVWPLGLVKGVGQA